MPNRISSEILDGIAEAFERVGGVDYLTELALKDPPTFCRLLARLIPQQIEANINSTNLDLGAAMADADRRFKQLEYERADAKDLSDVIAYGTN